MQKAILLLCFAFAHSFIFAQSNNPSFQSASKSDNQNQSEAMTFANFEKTVFNQSTTKEIITSYISLGKKQQDSGNSVNAAALFERAYVLAKDYYRSLPNDRNWFQQLENSYQSMLALCLLGRGTPDGINALRYLQQSNPNWVAGNAGQQQGRLSEEKVVAGFFMAATEEAAATISTNSDNYTLKKSTSLRAKATHRSRSLKRLSGGCNIVVTEKTNEFWWKVEVDGMVGYAKALLMVR